MSAELTAAPMADGKGVEAAAAFEALYLAHREPVFRYLRAITGDDDEALDLAALTFERALRELSRRRDGIGLGWLIRTARNAAIDVERHRRTVDLAHLRLATRQAAQPSLEETAVGLERARRVRSAVAALPRPQREALALRYSTDLVVREIGALIGKGEAATQKLISRGLARLKEVLDDA